MTIGLGLLAFAFRPGLRWLPIQQRSVRPLSVTSRNDRWIEFAVVRPRAQSRAPKAVSALGLVSCLARSALALIQGSPYLPGNRLDSASCSRSPKVAVSDHGLGCLTMCSGPRLSSTS